MKKRNHTEIRRDITDANSRLLEVQNLGDNALNFTDRLHGNTAEKTLKSLNLLLSGLRSEFDEATKGGIQLELF